MEEPAAVIPGWRKSSYSNSAGACVESGPVPGAVLIRDTKDNAAGPVLRATPADWHRFTSRIRLLTAGSGQSASGRVTA